jgi:hypothetical protein
VGEKEEEDSTHTAVFTASLSLCSLDSKGYLSSSGLLFISPHSPSIRETDRPEIIFEHSSKVNSHFLSKITSLSLFFSL